MRRGFAYLVAIMHCVSRKMLASEVAELLELSEKTIHHHVEHILGKLQARNRTQAVVKGLQLSLFLLE
jgi:DNA-binding NarL/FixJ family response regulator